jgi:aspartate/methionine/tyrosine aminotransferase
MLAPYYFSHKLALQLSGAIPAVCSFDPLTLYPEWSELEKMISTLKPKMVFSIHRVHTVLVLSDFA